LRFVISHIRRDETAPHVGYQIILGWSDLRHAQNNSAVEIYAQLHLLVVKSANGRQMDATGFRGCNLH
jgi:hypothetical protein